MGMDGEVSLGGESKLPTVKLPGDMGIAPPYMSSPTFAMLMPLLVVEKSCAKCRNVMLKTQSCSKRKTQNNAHYVFTVLYVSAF